MSFGGMIFTLDDTETSDDGYFRVYVGRKADSDGEYSSFDVADLQILQNTIVYLSVGDNADSENLAS